MKYLLPKRKRKRPKRVPKNKKNNLPKDVIDSWPEVFNNIEINTVPMKYLRSVLIYFKDGNVWDIDMTKPKNKNLTSEEIEDSIEQILYEYDDHIVNVDFELNVAKVKRDITKRTKYFLKKRK
jgi:hypothetical protein